MNHPLFQLANAILDWPAMTRQRFEDQLGPQDALLVDNPEAVAEKNFSHSKALGVYTGISSTGVSCKVHPRTICLSDSNNAQ